MVEQSSNSKLVNFEPAYWHMTGDSFPTRKTIGKAVTLKPEPSASENRSKIMVKLQDVQAAHERIKHEIMLTPVVGAKYIGRKTMNLFFKCENLQHAGSFKARGACNVLSTFTSSERSKGCVISGGRNFCEAMSYYGHIHSVPINVVVPKNCPIGDRQRFKENYAIVKLLGNDMNEASLHALSYCDQIGSKYVHGLDRLDLIAGYGTVGLELLQQMEKLDAIICPVGTGALVAGIIIAVKSIRPNIKVYGVECLSSPVMTRALQEKKPVMVEAKSSIADSLTSFIAGINAYHIIRGYIDRMINVDETFISRAMIYLLEREKLMVEGAGACAVAAILADKVPELNGKNVVCILSGANVNSSRMSRVIDRGLAAEGRLVKVTITLPDAPGALAKLLARMCEIGVDVRHLLPERTWLKRDIFNVSVNMVVETCDAAHSKELEKKLLKHYPQSHFIMV